MLGRLEQALGYLKLAAGLVPPIDHAAQATYSRRLADLQFELGRAASSRAAARTGNAKADGEAARKYLAEAGEEYLRLAKLSTLDPSATTSAVWQAAESFDLAGERARMIEVLETFVREYTDDMRVPEALLQLGRARQAAGQIPKAIAAYQRNLTEFPRTPAALGSLIPLSDCFRQTGATDKAEQILLRVVTPRPGDDLALITPEAPEYQDALFRLGDLYVEAEQYEKAISRYEEALDRYGKDPRADLATYRLADCYRRSAAQIRRDVARPENVAYKDGLLAMHQKRLQRANQLYQAFIDRYEKRSDASLSDLERMSVKLSHLYCADCVYDLSLVSGMQDTEPFARSLSMYEKAAWTYQREPIAMSAYVQIMNCYLHMGKVPQAWMALQRARWALRNIPDEEFAKFSPGQDRAYWDNYLGWLEKKPTFASVALAKAG
jgi:TolA-binding protein